MQREACWTRRGAGGSGVRPGQRLPRRRLPPPLLAQRRPPAPHPRPDRQRDQGARRPLDPPLPPGDLRPRQDRRLHLRGPPAPRADPAPRRRVAAGPQGHRRDRGLRRLTPARLLHPPRRDPRGGGAGRLRPRPPGRDPRHPRGRRRPTSRARRCASAGAPRPRRSASTARRSSAASTRARPEPGAAEPARSLPRAARPCGHGGALPLRPPRRDPGRRRARFPTERRAPRSSSIADAFLASEAVIRIAESAKGPRYTTRRIWELEREALAAAERMRSAGTAPGRRADRGHG